MIPAINGTLKPPPRPNLSSILSTEHAAIHHINVLTLWTRCGGTPPGQRSIRRSASSVLNTLGSFSPSGSAENARFPLPLVTLCLSFQRRRRGPIITKTMDHLLLREMRNPPRSEARDDVEYVKDAPLKAAGHTDVPSCLVGELHQNLVTNAPCLHHSEAELLRTSTRRPCDLPPLEHVRSKAQWRERKASKDTR